MYLVGAAHPHKLDAERLVTDVEVLQEICHRHTAINRRDAIQPAFDAVLGVVDEVLPIERSDAEAAKDIVLAYGTLSAHDALHLAVMRRRRVERIMSFDQGFDSFPGISRLHRPKRTSLGRAGR